jgi:hypothetical protein
LVEAALRRFELVTTTSPGLAMKAARNYRILRARGIAIRQTIQLLIGRLRIAAGLPLLPAVRSRLRSDGKASGPSYRLTSLTQRSCGSRDLSVRWLRIAVRYRRHGER